MPTSSLSSPGNLSEEKINTAGHSSLLAAHTPSQEKSSGSGLPPAARHNTSTPLFPPVPTEGSAQSEARPARLSLPTLRTPSQQLRSGTGPQQPVARHNTNAPLSLPSLASSESSTQSPHSRLQIIRKNAAQNSADEQPTMLLKAVKTLERPYGDPSYPSFDEIPVDEQATVPMMVLTGIAVKQGEAAPEMKSEISGSASNAAFVGLGNILGTVLKYGITVVISRFFGAGVFGLYTLGLSIISLFSSTLTLGLDDAVMRYVPIYRARKQGGSLRGLVIFCTLGAAAAGLIGSALIFFFAPGIIDVFKPGHSSDTTELILVLQLLAPGIPLGCMESIWTGGLTGFKDFRWRVLSQKLVMPMLLILSLFIVAIFFRSSNLVGVMVAVLINDGTSSFFAFWFFRDKVTNFAQEEPERYETKQWLGFAVPNFLTNTTDLVLDSVDTLLLASFNISSIALGQYAAAQKISGFIGMPLQALNTMFAPTIAELHAKGEQKKLEEMFKVVTKWAITFSLPIFGVAVLFASSLLSIQGQKFTEAWPLVIAFSAGNMVNVGTGSVGYMLMMTGHQKASFFNSLATFVLNLVLGWFLAGRYGAMGVAAATGLSLAVVNILRLLQVRFLLKMQPYRWDTLKPIGAWIAGALVTGGGLLLLQHFSVRVMLFKWALPVQLGLVPVFLAVYAGLLFLMGVSPEDAIVLNAVRKKLKRGKKGKGKKAS
ncbi:oligosaccharide flippase family protein [Ktedonosporobacter rubrisoli]|uniref:oligosaccharide flippase family protein n=1 Tax=Ktedonosporobacter rubrisoli TaxID=2509675 RepID=UPI0013EE5636|nr:oligosaccharide flippase family protein [Ktedonosporobacter rubrisoli]